MLIEIDNNNDDAYERNVLALRAKKCKKVCRRPRHFFRIFGRGLAGFPLPGLLSFETLHFRPWMLAWSLSCAYSSASQKMMWMEVVFIDDVYGVFYFCT